MEKTKKTLLSGLFDSLKESRFNPFPEYVEQDLNETGLISNEPIDDVDYGLDTPKKNTKIDREYYSDQYTLDERKLFAEQYERQLLEGNFKFGRFANRISIKELVPDFLIGGGLYKLVKDGEGMEHPVFCSRYNAFTNTVSFTKRSELDQDTLKLAYLSFMKEGKTKFYLNRSIKAPETIADQHAYFAAAYKAAMSLNIGHDQIIMPKKFAAFKESLRQESTLTTDLPEGFDEPLYEHDSLKPETIQPQNTETEVKEIIQPKPENEAKEKAELSIKENPNHMFLFRTRDDENGEPKYLAFLTPDSKDDLESMKKGFAHIAKDQSELIPQIKGVYRAAGYEENLQDILKKEDNCLEGYKLLRDIQNGVINLTAKPAKEMIDETNIVPIKKPETDNLKPKESEPKPKTRSTPKPKR